MCNLFPQKKFYWTNPDSKFQTQKPYQLIHCAIHFRTILAHHQNEGLSFHCWSLTWESRMPSYTSLLFLAWHYSFTLAPLHIYIHIADKRTIFSLYLVMCKVHNTAIPIAHVQRLHVHIAFLSKYWKLVQLELQSNYSSTNVHFGVVVHSFAKIVLW